MYNKASQQRTFGAGQPKAWLRHRLPLLATLNASNQKVYCPNYFISIGDQ
jgi:hypothetical protein